MIATNTTVPLPLHPGRRHAEHAWLFSLLFTHDTPTHQTLLQFKEHLPSPAPSACLLQGQLNILPLWRALLCMPTPSLVSPRAASSGPSAGFSYGALRIFLSLTAPPLSLVCFLSVFSTEPTG